ncbi:hypothetical protein QE416_000133 [Microbacterium sp. SORGH_AS 421]|nr:hypothetical protein [Microbacterium sp. SORGH_AS_0421]
MFHHLNDHSGAITVCRNPMGCTVEWHYRSFADAQDAYEAGMQDFLLPAPSRKEAAR